VRNQSYVVRSTLDSKAGVKEMPVSKVLPSIVQEFNFAVARAIRQEETRTQNIIALDLKLNYQKTCCVDCLCSAMCFCLRGGALKRKNTISQLVWIDQSVSRFSSWQTRTFREIPENTLLANECSVFSLSFMLGPFEFSTWISEKFWTCQSNQRKWLDLWPISDTIFQTLIQLLSRICFIFPLLL